MYQPRFVTDVINLWVMGKALSSGTGEWFLIQRFVLTLPAYQNYKSRFQAVWVVFFFFLKQAFCFTAFRGQTSESAVVLQVQGKVTWATRLL